MPLLERARYEMTLLASPRPSFEKGCTVSSARSGASLPSGAGVLRRT
jgi:hypothetical protein